MKKYLLPKDGSFYKANLHCHTTVSDGRKSPEEVKELYKKNGYSVVAYTDHDFMLPHHDLTDEDFLALTGFEIQLTETDPEIPSKFKKTSHLCFIALDKDNVTQVCHHRTKYRGYYNKHPEIFANHKYDESAPDFEREHTPECVNEAIRIGKEAGFFVSYNHPTWSLDRYSDYINYKGMDAMEIVNYSCVTLGYDEYNSRVYDDMLIGGQRIFCTSTDDNHNAHPDGTVRSDSCGGYVMIKADRLEYNCITSALKAGHFYASTGPEIKELYIEDGKLYVKTSPAKSITFSTPCRWKSTVKETDTEVTEAVFNLDAPEASVKDCYFRITVTDSCGHTANSSAYFFDTL